MTKINVAQFVREVRQETAKVTWPTRRETTLSTAMVVLMVVAAAAFLFVVDQVLAFGVRILLGI